MNFFQSKKKMFMLLVTVILAAALWYVWSKSAEKKEPEGTLVWKSVCTEVRR